LLARGKRLERAASLRTDTFSAEDWDDLDDVPAEELEELEEGVF
ncbi:hypothetical protein LCGC14_1055600, partial [marine sediment metagenome]